MAPGVAFLGAAPSSPFEGGPPADCSGFLVLPQMPLFPPPRLDAAESSDEVVLLMEPPYVAPRRLSLPGQLVATEDPDSPPDLHRHCSDPGS